MILLLYASPQTSSSCLFGIEIAIGIEIDFIADRL